MRLVTSSEKLTLKLFKGNIPQAMGIALLTPLRHYLIFTGIASAKKLAQKWHRSFDIRKGSYDFHRNSLKFLVGMTRFELATP